MMTAQAWAIRCCHEASLYEKNIFVTLTYNNKHLPKNGSLNVKHFQDFMKRLREKYGKGIRYFHCGEYGAKLGRPHYHACIFNFDFPDKELAPASAQPSHGKYQLYISSSLNKLWPAGFSTIGSLTFESAAYVARYVLKKVPKKEIKKHYGKRKPEYVTMSRRPGIGKGWFDKYRTDLYPGDFVVLNQKKMKVPKYYDRLLEKEFPEEFKKVKIRRKIRASKHLGNEEGTKRIIVLESLLTKKLQRNPRRFEEAMSDIADIELVSDCGTQLAVSQT